MIQKYIDYLNQKEANENISNCLARQRQKEIRKEVSAILEEKY